MKGGKNSEADCLVCEEPILESGEHCEVNEAVFCEGSCQGWLHRKCAGLTHLAFDTRQCVFVLVLHEARKFQISLILLRTYTLSLLL